MKQFYFLIVAILLPLLKAQGQSDFREGFIITQKGDSLTGLIKYNGERQNAEMCQFKKKNTENIENLTAADIEYYSFINDRQYTSKKIKYDFKESFYFLELIVKGKVSLYFFRDAKETQHFYIEKAGELSLTELTIDYIQRNDKPYQLKTYHNILIFALKEANFSKNKIEATTLLRNPLTKLIKEYNQKVDKENLVLVLDNPRKNKTIRIRPGFYLGLNTNSYHFNSQPVFFTNDKFGPGKSLSFSLFANFYFHYWKKSFISLQPELDYSHSTINVQYLFKGQSFQSTYQLKYLKLPVKMKVEIGKQSSAFLPYISGGAFYGFNLSPETNTSGATFYYTPQQFYKITNEVPRVQFGLMVGAGLDYKINTKSRLSLEARVEILPATKMNYYYGETITEEEYQTNREKYRQISFYDNKIFSKLDHYTVKSSIRTASVRIGFRF